MITNLVISRMLRPIVLLSIALVMAASALLIHSCSGGGGGVLSPDGTAGLEAARMQAAYEQAQAEAFAPLLLFDEDQGESDNCFPMDAGVYYQARLDGNRGRIQNLDRRTITNGVTPPSLPQPPTYYVYQKYEEIFRLGSMNGAANDTCVALLAGKSMDVGTVCAAMSDSGVTVTVSTIAGWEMTEVHLWAGRDLAEMPRTRKGNPKVGHFPFHEEATPGLTSCSFEIPWSDFNHTMYAALHAEVRDTDGNETFQAEGAWAAGNRIAAKGNWATYFSVEFELVSKIEYITYWWFYGWQDECDGVSGSHHADWERVIVKIRNNTIDRVLYYQHKGWYVRNPGRYEMGYTNHPNVYVGRKNHGSYHWNDYMMDVQTCCYWDDQREPGPWGSSMKLLSWYNLIPLRTDEDAPEWMKYGGEWGGTNLDDGIWAPQTRSNFSDMSNTPGCEGDDGRWCHTSGCWQSDIGDDQIF